MQKFKIMHFNELTSELIDCEYRFFVVMKDEIESGWSYHCDAVDARSELIDALPSGVDINNLHFRSSAKGSWRPRVKKLNELTLEQLKKFCDYNGYQLHVVL